MRRAIFGMLAIGIATVLSLLSLEVAVRLGTGSLIEWRNYATDPINLVKVMSVIEFDETLGWILTKDRPDLEQGPWHNRVHRTSISAKDTRPILAVGDSFTFGSEVLADETWPAQLEQIMSAPVINGGVGGYGIDQIVLWAERLVPEVKPKLLIMSFIPNDITRTRMSVFSGATKPLFRVVDGSLRAQNLPLTFYRPSMDYAGWRTVFGYSKSIDWTMQRAGLTHVWRAANFEDRYEEIDATEVSCTFIKRLARLAIPTLVVAQHGWNDFIVPDGLGNAAQARVMLECAKSVGLKALDTHDTIRADLRDRTQDDYKRLYVNGVGHMTKQGNKIVAEEIAKSIAGE